MEAHEFLLKENALTDNILFVAPKNHIFKGGYLAYVKEFVYQNAWSDRLLPIKRFRSKDRLMKYLEKTYPEVVNDLDFTDTNLT